MVIYTMHFYIKKVLFLFKDIFLMLGKWVFEILFSSSFSPIPFFSSRASVAQPSHKLMAILLSQPQPPKSWDYRHGSMTRLNVLEKGSRSIQGRF